jgi:hypothetical protein
MKHLAFHHWISKYKMPPPTAPTLKSSSTSSWKEAQNASDSAEKRMKEAEEKHNASHWEKDLPGMKQWTTITDFDDLKNRIHCLLRKYTDPLSLLISFDFDGTLGARRSMLSSGKTKDHKLSKQDTFDQEIQSVDVLNFLNTKGVPFFVNTAANNPCRAKEAMSSNDHYEQTRPAMPMSSVLIQAGMSTETREDLVHYGVRFARCGHSFSAEYEKHVPIDYVIDTYKLPTKVIIHVDDGIINIQTVLAAGFTQHVIGMYFPTVEGTTIGEEPNKDAAFDYLYSPTENIRSIGLTACGAGTSRDPFRSKADADRFQKSTGHRYRKGDTVHYIFKRVAYTQWQW